MVSARKRPREAGDEWNNEDQSELRPELKRLRNMWRFACLCQWCYIFGSVLKLENLDIDELEAQCLSPHSTALEDIGLALLKFLSSHRGLTQDLFDEYTRRQYTSKAPNIPNPFGTDATAKKFSDFTLSQKVRVLHQMTQFIMMNPEKLREKMAEQKDADHDQTTWRIEPFGWDREDNVYYVLDDNRVYRMMEPPSPPVKPKKNSKKGRAEARRNSKRRRTISASHHPAGVAEAEPMTAADVDKMAVPATQSEEDTDDRLGDMKWECVAVSLGELRDFLATIPGKKDPNEKILRDKIVGHLLPILEQQEERRKKREKERERELLNLAKMANAKRSSRIANRQAQHKQEEVLRDEELKRRHELEVHRKEEQKQRKMEKERDNRLLSREKRLRERELRRAQHEDELAQLSEDSRNFDSSAGRMSERRRLAEIEKNKEALRELEEESEEEWVFDCICGLHGKVDDGQHSVSCERCSIWQHSRCLGIDEEEAEKDDFHFICGPCRHKGLRAESSGSGPRLPVIKFKSSKPAVPLLPSTSPVPEHSKFPELCIDIPTIGLSMSLPNAVSSRPELVLSQTSVDTASTARMVADGNRAYDHTVLQPALQSALGPPQRRDAERPVPVKVDCLAAPVSPSASKSTVEPGLCDAKSGHANPFSSSHPGLSQPGQSPRKSHAYSTIFEQTSLAPQNGSQQGSEYRSASSAATTQSAGTLPYSLNRNMDFWRSETSAAATFAKDSEAQFALISPSQPAPQHQTLRRPSPTPLSGGPGDPSLTRQQWASSLLATPRLHHSREEDQIAMRYAQPSSPLLPSHGGLSPTKHSPADGKGQIKKSSATSPIPTIIPPAAALSPSTPKQDLTPPVKLGGPAHRQSFSDKVSHAISSPVEAKVDQRAPV